MEDADRLRDEVLGEISRAETPDALEAIRVAAPGRLALRPAHSHLAVADPHDAGSGAADQHHRPGPHLPCRSRRDAFADVPSGRGAGDRPDDPYGPSERLFDRVLPRLF